jgi:hypothetical protein
MARIGRMTTLHSRALAQRAEPDGTAAQDATLPRRWPRDTLGGAASGYTHDGASGTCC